MTPVTPFMLILALRLWLYCNLIPLIPGIRMQGMDGKEVPQKIKHQIKLTKNKIFLLLQKKNGDLKDLFCPTCFVFSKKVNQLISSSSLLIEHPGRIEVSLPADPGGLRIMLNGENFLFGHTGAAGRTVSKT